MALLLLQRMRQSPGERVDIVRDEIAGARCSRRGDTEEQIDRTEAPAWSDQAIKERCTHTDKTHGSNQKQHAFQHGKYDLSFHPRYARHSPTALYLRN